MIWWIVGIWFVLSVAHAIWGYRYIGKIYPGSEIAEKLGDTEEMRLKYARTGAFVWFAIWPFQLVASLFR